jgi:peptidyl-prolyl cis-trans isomerase B (cyclophilin B)
VTVAYSPPPGQQYYPPYQPYQAYPPARPTNGLAIAALICGVAAFVTGISFIPAVICGHLARREIRRTGEQGYGMATAGLVCGYIGGILSIAVVLIIGLLAARAASTVTNMQLLPAYSTSAAPVGAPAPAVPIVPPTAALPSPGQ